jgi:hypothetical protein
LWDLKAEYDFNRLGDSLAHWQQLLTEIKKARSTFDTSDRQKSFGVCVGSIGMEIGGIDMEEEVKEAYEVVKRIGVRDVSVGRFCSPLWTVALF